MHRSNQKSKKTVLRLALFFNLLLIILVACQPGSKTPAPGYATWTPSPSATATCIPNISLSTPEGWGSSRLIVILFDPRSMGDQYLELENKEKTQDISFFVGRMIPRLIKPGDQISVFQLGYSSFDDAVVTRLFSYVEVPQLYNTPSPRETLTPLPPTNVPTPGFVAVATHNAVVVQSTQRAGTETANKARYGCEVIYWNNIVMSTATAWGAIATSEIGELNKKLNEEMKDFYEIDDDQIRETPFKTNELYYGGLYNGLNFASTVFRAECKNYTECILLIVDDLQFYGQNNPDNLPIDLKGIKIDVVIPNCRYIDQPSCMKVRDYWNNEFIKFGAGEAEYWNGVRVEINLLNAIGR